MADFDFQQAWWQGLQLWYNQGAYLEAMECWEEGLAHCADWDDEQDPAPIEERLSAGGFNSRAAPLLLFLAGCQLDAGRIVEARTNLFRCLRSCKGGYDSHVARLAFCELISSYEEGSDTADPWIQAKEIVSFASEQGCSYWHSHYQRPGYLFAFRNQHKPVLLKSEHPPWCKFLEANAGTIRNEFQHLYGSSGSTSAPEHWPTVGAGDHRNGAGQHDASVIESGDWREVVLFGSGARPHLAPLTSNLLQQHAPDAVSLANEGGGEIIFSLLFPGTSIRPHCGSTNFRLTAHLGLVIPEECSIRVADTWCKWKEAEVLVFDDSFEHEVVNKSNQIRAVLLLRFWHPSLPKQLRKLALDAALQSKQEDQLRRFNPPLPKDSAAFTKRGLETGRCRQCGMSGYQSMRVQQPGRLFCVCGCPIA